MKIRTTAALAAALAMGTATAALAQDRGGDHHDWNHGGGGGDHHPPAAAPQQPAPQPGQGFHGQGEHRGWNGGDHAWNGGGDHNGWRARGGGSGDVPQAAAPQVEQRAWRDRNRGASTGQGGSRPWQGGDHNSWRGPAPSAVPNQAWQDHRRDNGGDRFARGGDQWRGDRGDQWRGDRNHQWRGDREHWRPGYFPQRFRAEHRFRLGAYFPPVGWGFRDWSYGEILPQAWWTPEYQIGDWWDYDLPQPPPGFMWVRDGANALLIDPYGRVVQVVDYIFY